MFCSKCGANVADNADFCPACGAPLRAAARPAAPVVQPVDPEMNEAACAQSLAPWQHRAFVKIMAIICYLGLPVFLPFFLMKKQKYMRSHVNNGIVLLIFSAGIEMIAFIPIVGWIAGFVVGGYLCVMEIMGIVHASKGETFRMPILGGIKIVR